MNEHLLFLDLGFMRIYWFGLFAGCAILTAAVLFCILRRLQGERLSQALDALLLSLPVGFIAARVSYCWFRQASFSGRASDYLHLSEGGFSLFGGLSGIAVMLLLFSARKRLSFLKLMDAAVPALSAAIAAGRFAGVTGGEETGFEIKTDCSAPFVRWSETEQANVLWVGYFEGIFALIITGMVLYLFFRKYIRKNAGLREGCVTLCFMLTFGLSQAFLESMRSDSLFMVTLGFVRIDQIISILMAVAAFVIISIDNARVCGLSACRLSLWAICAAALALAVVCEFTLSATYLAQIYTRMAASLFVIWISGILLFADTARNRYAAGKKA